MAAWLKLLAWVAVFVLPGGLLLLPLLYAAHRREESLRASVEPALVADSTSGDPASRA